MRRDTVLFIVIVLALSCIGSMTVYSVSAVRPGMEGAFKHHVGAIIIGLACMFVASHTDYRLYKKHEIFRALAVATLLLLVFVLVFGEEVRGARRWIRILTFQFQPSEIAKVAVIIFLALKMSENQDHIKSLFRGFIPSISIALLFAGMIVLEPDLGVPVVIVATAYVMMFIAGVRVHYLIGSLVPVVSAVVGLILMYPYRIERMIAFTNPYKHRDSIGYHLIQSLAAFARGAIWGLGPGAGQQKLNYLPDAHTDFIFAVWGEEMGLVGTLLVVGLFVLLVRACLRIAQNAPDLFGSLLATGIAALIAFQAALNIAVTIGLVPTKGLPLPFVSYGGTATVVFLGLAGIMVNIGSKSEPQRQLLPVYGA
jgi:cell division protein FtsW